MRFKEMVNPVSPVEDRRQYFVWMGEYEDGTSIAEFDFDTKAPVKFDSIDKGSLSRFGLVGGGHKLFFEIAGGTFNIVGKEVDFVIESGGELYPLTMTPYRHDDVITFKEAHTYGDIRGGGATQTEIVGYYFGFKDKSYKFNTRIMCCIPVNGSLHFLVRVVPEFTGEASVAILIDGVVVERLPINLTAGVGSELSWTFR